MFWLAITATIKGREEFIITSGLKKNIFVNMLLLNVQQQKLRSQLQFTVRKDTESETVLSYCAELLSLS